MTVAKVLPAKIFNPVWCNPQKSYAERISGAIAYLDSKIRTANVVGACEQIEKVIREQRKYRLFQKYFPEEWNCSESSLFKAGFYQNYTERANEFFELVNEHLFPLLEGWNDDPETDFDNFNIFSLNVDLCCDDVEYEYLQISYVAVLLIFSQSEDIWEFLEENYQIKPDQFPNINHSCFENIWDLEKTGRTGLYLDVFEIVDHSTGNPWLDTTNCRYYENYLWDEKTVDYLSRTYHESQDLLAKTLLLDELFAANPKEILAEMIALWNTGKIPSTGKAAGFSN